MDHNALARMRATYFNELYIVTHTPYNRVRLMYEQKTNQSNLLTVCLIIGCALWSVKYGMQFTQNANLHDASSIMIYHHAS